MPLFLFQVIPLLFPRLDGWSCRTAKEIIIYTECTLFHPGDSERNSCWDCVWQFHWHRFIDFFDCSMEHRHRRCLPRFWKKETSQRINYNNNRNGNPWNKGFVKQFPTNIGSVDLYLLLIEPQATMNIYYVHVMERNIPDPKCIIIIITIHFLIHVGYATVPSKFHPKPSHPSPVRLRTVSCP